MGILPVQISSHQESSGNTHVGGSVIFFRNLSSAISSILSKEVSSINFEVDSLNSILGHLSPKTQPLTQASAQLIFCSTINSSLIWVLSLGK